MLLSGQDTSQLNFDPAALLGHSRFSVMHCIGLSYALQMPENTTEISLDLSSYSAWPGGDNKSLSLHSLRSGSP